MYKVPPPSHLYWGLKGLALGFYHLQVAFFCYRKGLQKHYIKMTTQPQDITEKHC